MLCKSEGRELVSRVVGSKNVNDNDGSQLTAQRQAMGVLIGKKIEIVVAGLICNNERMGVHVVHFATAM